MSANFSHLPPDMRRALAAEVAPGERIVYAGMPDWRGTWRVLAAILLFGVFWSSISFLFFGTSVAGLLGLAEIKSGKGIAGTGMLVFLLVFSLPFVAIGCALLAAPFLAIRKSRRTVHAVTDVRLLNVYRGQGAESYPLEKINFIKRRDHRNGVGSLEIGYGVERDSDGDPRPLTADWTGIPDAKRAEAEIRRLAKWVR